MWNTILLLFGVIFEAERFNFMQDRRKHWKNSLSVIFALTFLINNVVWVSHHASGAAVNHQAVTTISPQAATVYGQGVSFTSATANNGGISATSLNGARSIVFDTNKDIYISDTANNRVLYYPAGTTTATIVYGQPGLGTNTANNGGISATSLNNPNAVALDSSGNLYVSDAGNNRVLYYPIGSTTATRVYGQAGSFSSGTANNGGISSNSLSAPTGLTLDSNGNLYVSDAGNNRVLYYPAGSTTATRVYGQAGSFSSGTANYPSGTPSTTSLLTPYGLDLDSSGNLYISDSGNSRVLYYVAGSTTATRVYGQGVSFTIGTANNGGVSATSLNVPGELALDSNNNLYVADTHNNRVLYYAGTSTTATRVYGQAGDLTTGSSGVTAFTLNQPYGVAIDSSGKIYVSDSTNNRALQFQTGLSITTQPPATSPPPAPAATFSVAATLIDVKSGATFSDFTGSVSAAITTGSGTAGAVLSGATPVSASSGVATFSNTLSIDRGGSGYTLTLSSPGVGSATTNAFAIGVSPKATAEYGQGAYGGGNSFTGLQSTVSTIDGTTLGSASSVAFDSSGNLYVADYYNNRVLFYPTGGFKATRVYGQGTQGTTFTTSTTSTPGTSSSGMNGPKGVAIDSSNNLYVADTGNNRVLFFPSVANGAGTAAFTATQVYGQGTAGTAFTTATVATTSSGMSGPTSVSVDSSNNLYVADTGNNRVLSFTPATFTATHVFGQGTAGTAFTTKTVATTSSGMHTPTGIDLDSSNNLYVADSANNRVLFFPSAAYIATRVYGQGTAGNVFTTATVATTSSGMSSPKGIAVDSNNNLYVADSSNNRVLFFPSVANGAGTAVFTATRVYGQGGSLTTGTATNVGGGTNAIGLSSPQSVVTSSGNVYVADDANSRVLDFQISLNITTQPPASLQTGSSFSTAVNLIDGGSGGVFSDFTGTVSVAITAGTGVTGAVLSGATPVSASSGVATFSALSINLGIATYALTLSSPGVGSATSNSIVVTGVPSSAGYWPFNEGRGTTAYDYSGNHNQGTVTGTGASTNWTTAGKVNGALSFDGSTNDVSMGTPAALKFGTGSFSAMTWFKTTGTPTSVGRMVSTGIGVVGGVPSYSPGFDLSLNLTCTGCVSVEVGGGGSSATSLSLGTTANTFNNNAWHQAVMVIDRTGNTAKLYVDGTAQSLNATGCTTASGVTSVNISATACTSNLNATGASNEPFTVGAGQHADGSTFQWFHGALDEVHMYSSALSSTQVADQNKIDTPAGYWPFDENSGTTASDLSGNSNNGTLSGTTIPTWTTGKTNSGLNFIGTTGYVLKTTPTAALTFGVNSFTVMNWFKTSNLTAGQGRMVSTGDTTAGGTAGYFTSVGTSVGTVCTGCVGAGVGGSSLATSLEFRTTSSFNDGTWHQEAMVIDRTAKTAQIYVDGVVQNVTTPASGYCINATGTVTSVNITGCSSLNATVAATFTMGAYATSSEAFNGSLDEVRVYNSALSSTQVQDQYNIDAAIPTAAIPTLAGYWPLNNNSGTTASDLSGNGNNGALSTTPPTWIHGQVNGALSFDGASNYVSMAGGTTPSALQFATGSSFTIIAWFNASPALTSEGRIVSEGLVSSTVGGFLLGMGVSSATCTAAGSTTSYGCVGGEIGTNTGNNINWLEFQTATAFNDGKWHQAAMVITGGLNAQMYIDGVAQTLVMTLAGYCGASAGTSFNFTGGAGTCTGMSYDSTDPSLSLGAYTGPKNATFQYFTGGIDEVRAYSGALSSAQIQSQYINDFVALNEYAISNTMSFAGSLGSTATYTLPIALTDQIIPAPGWSISITSTTLFDGVSHYLPTTASAITAVTGACTTSGTCSSDLLTNTTTNLPVSLPAGTTAPGAIRFFGTAAGTGTGVYTVTPTISVTIPYTVPIGTYTSTITLTAASGP
jgi:hypothetical protein